MDVTTRLINDEPIGEKQACDESTVDSISKLIYLGEPEDGSKYEVLPTCQDGAEEQIISISPKPISRERCLKLEEMDHYYYFVLKNGSRITAFRVAKDRVGNISNFINDSLEIYPEGSEIYQVNFEEYFDIRKTVRELRRSFQRIRKRNIQYRNVEKSIQNKVLESSIEGSESV